MKINIQMENIFMHKHDIIKRHHDAYYDYFGASWNFIAAARSKK